MAKTEKTARVCNKGHRYYKSSDCPVCPLCEKAKTSADTVLAKLSAPARRALESIGVKSLKQLVKFRAEDLLEVHGMGPSAISKLKTGLKASGLSFKA